MKTPEFNDESAVESLLDDLAFLEVNSPRMFSYACNYVSGLCQGVKITLYSPTEAELDFETAQEMKAFTARELAEAKARIAEYVNRLDRHKLSKIIEQNSKFTFSLPDITTH